MTSLDTAVDEVRDRAVDFLNSEGRSASHVALGVALTAGFALAATLLATRTIEPRARSLSNLKDKEGPVVERPKGPLSLILPAVFSATTLSAVRVWNAPNRPERKAAMGLWMAAQATNAVWLSVRPASRSLQILAAMTSAGLAAAFAHEARKLDDTAGSLASPMGAGVKLANRADKEAADTLH
jgi:translocator protein